jgi:hypothetical protein
MLWMGLAAAVAAVAFCRQLPRRNQAQAIQIVFDSRFEI